MDATTGFWPNGARLTVTVSMQFAAGGQPTSGAGGPITEPVLAELPDLGQHSFCEHGARGASAATRTSPPRWIAAPCT